MNPSSIALLIVALLMASASPGADRVDVLVGGTHDATGSRAAVIVVDGVLDVDAGDSLEGPVYVVGGLLRVAGSVAGDVVQLAGTVDIDATATLDAELRHIAGSLEIAPGAQIASRAEFETAEPSSGIGGATSTVVAAAVLAGIGVLAVRRRPKPLANISAAAFEHPVVSLTVGSLVTVTFLAIFVFMAFTLILLPIAVLGIAVGLIAAILGLIALGRGLGRRLPIEHDAIATGVGVAALVVSIQVVGWIPFVGDWLALSALLAGVGAVIVTYFGVARFEVESLPGLADAQGGRRSPSADD